MPTPEEVAREEVRRGLGASTQQQSGRSAVEEERYQAARAKALAEQQKKT